jgi:hypothetical protein
MTQGTWICNPALADRQCLFAHRTAAGTTPTGRPAVAGLVYVLPIAVAASVGATVRAGRLAAGGCVGEAVAPLT